MLTLLAACGSAPPLADTPRPVAVEPAAAEAVRDPAPPIEPGSWEGPAALRHAQDALARCPAVPVDLPRSEDLEEGWTSFEASFADGVLSARTGTFGNGVDGVHAYQLLSLRVRDCSVVSGGFRWYDGSLGATAFIDEGRPDDALLRAWFGEPMDPADPRHAYARMVLTGAPCADESLGADPGSWRLVPLDTGPQPWLAGPVRRPVDVFVPRQIAEQLNPGRTEDDLDDDEEAEDVAGVLMFRLAGEPRAARTLGGLELYETELSGRNGGVALAVYDTAADRHRWLGVTRGCVNGTRVRWFAEGSDLLLGWARSQHPVYAEYDGLLLVDLAAGRTYRVDLAPDLRRPRPDDDRPDEELSDEEAAGLGFARDAVVLRGPAGHGRRVTLAELRRRIDASSP